ncbi:MAG: GGDEF domain-containing protein [Desulfobacterales bacterium]|nr:GGDEF domain-containing protein [Desulfobacterales bacterium]
MIFSKIFEMVNVGIVVLDKDLNVYKWNRWMETHSRIPAKKIEGSPLFSFFPNLDNPLFNRNLKAVRTFGNFAFFSQKLHGRLFAFRATNTLGSTFEYMQQSCTMGPLRGEDNAIDYVYILVHDVTDVAAYEQKLIEMNTRDALTEVYNRRYLESRLEEEFRRHERYSIAFSVIMLDIDYFKSINDVHGHQCGDFILKEFALLVGATIRDVDILARYGGEEFCCLLPETELASGLITAERIREKTEKQVFHFNGKDIKITVSQGVAELSEGLDAPDALLNKADAALYEAKKRGRNRVVPRSRP